MAPAARSSRTRRPGKGAPPAPRANTAPPKPRRKPKDEPLFVEAGPAQWEAVAVAFIRRHVEAAGAKGLVLGVSGGLDSAVVAALCVKAIGRSKVLPLILPAADSDPLDEKHARLVCSALGIKPRKVSIAPIVDGIMAALGRKPDPRTLGNAKSRTRMVLLYAIAQPKGMLVCGTGNKSELLSGYFTKWGDGSADLMPIGDLYKTQVRQLARHLGIPRPIIAKPPSAGLRPGQTDEGDMGVTYEELDAVLRGIELNHDLDVIARKTKVPPAKVGKVNGMVRATEHKRRLAIVPKIGARTVGIDWKRSVHWDA